VTTALGFLDVRTEAYVDEVVRAIDAQVPVVEAYLVGSGAVGGFDPRTSDVDLVVVVERPLGAHRRPLVERLLAVECPVRDLELVVYVEGVQPPDFELNVSEGEERPDEDAFWFVLDSAIAQEQAVPLRAGRPWKELFEQVSDERVREAVCESLAWSARQPTDDDFAGVNAARARHYLEHGTWISKREARG
jgi:predicted nucleotidyltransferase